MPVKKCSNGKYRIGSGQCMYKSKASAERAYKGYLGSKHMNEKIDINEKSMSTNFMFDSGMEVPVVVTYNISDAEIEITDVTTPADRFGQPGRSIDIDNDDIELLKSEIADHEMHLQDIEGEVEYDRISDMRRGMESTSVEHVNEKVDLKVATVDEDDMEATDLKQMMRLAGIERDLADDEKKDINFRGALRKPVKENKFSTLRELEEEIQKKAALIEDYGDEPNDVTYFSLDDQGMKALGSSGFRHFVNFGSDTELMSITTDRFRLLVDAVSDRGGRVFTPDSDDDDYDERIDDYDRNHGITDDDDGRNDDHDDDDYDDSMDGDHESGLASAGFGTDEDYGHYGTDESIGRPQREDPFAGVEDHEREFMDYDGNYTDQDDQEEDQARMRRNESIGRPQREDPFGGVEDYEKEFMDDEGKYTDQADQEEYQARKRGKFGEGANYMKNRGVKKSHKGPMKKSGAKKYPAPRGSELDEMPYDELYNAPVGYVSENHFDSDAPREKKYFGVFVTGVSIGRNDNKPYKVYDNMFDAQRHANKLERQLTRSERENYQMKYVVRPTDKPLGEDASSEKKLGRRKAGSWGRPGSAYEKRLASKGVRRSGKEEVKKTDVTEEYKVGDEVETPHGHGKITGVDDRGEGKRYFIVKHTDYKDADGDEIAVDPFHLHKISEAGPVADPHGGAMISPYDKEPSSQEVEKALDYITDHLAHYVDTDEMAKATLADLKSGNHPEYETGAILDLISDATVTIRNQLDNDDMLYFSDKEIENIVKEKFAKMGLVTEGINLDVGTYDRLIMEMILAEMKLGKTPKEIAEELSFDEGQVKAVCEAVTVVKKN